MIFRLLCRVLCYNYDSMEWRSKAHSVSHQMRFEKSLDRSCPHCKSPLPDAVNLRFCPRCGVALDNNPIGINAQSRATPLTGSASPTHPAYAPTVRAIPPSPRQAPEPAAHVTPTPTSQVNRPKPRFAFSPRLGGAFCVVIGLSAWRVFGPIIHDHFTTVPQAINSAIPGSAFPLSSRLHTFAVGDTWDYSLTGTISDNSGQVTPIANGAMHVEIINKSWFHGPTIHDRTVVSFSVVRGGQTEAINDVTSRTLSQDTRSGDVYLVAGDEHGQVIRHLQAPGLDQPGTWSDTTQWASNLAYDNGDREDTTASVVGREWATTPLGRLGAWKVSQQQRDTHGTTSSTMWIAPQLGVPVINDAVTQNGGQTIKLHAVLVRTTVRLGGA